MKKILTPVLFCLMGTAAMAQSESRAANASASNIDRVTAAKLQAEKAEKAEQEHIRMKIEAANLQPAAPVKQSNGQVQAAEKPKTQNN